MTKSQLYLSDRHWYHAEQARHVMVPHLTNHVSYVHQNPALFGITPDDLAGCDSRDYSHDTLAMMFRRGWVRVRFKRRSPDVPGTNIEGGSWRDLRAALRWIQGQVDLHQIFMTVRESDHAHCYSLDADGIRAVLRGHIEDHRITLNSMASDATSAGTI